MRVAIIMPTGDMMHTDTAMCLARVFSFSWDDHYAVINPRSSTIAKGRWQGVKEALKMNPDRILFIDSDMVFKPADIRNLLNHNVDIVSGLCTTRREPIQHVARDVKGNRIDLSDKTGLVKVASTGMAFASIKPGVFQCLPEPWFDTTYSDGRWVSEDEHFCLAAARAGFHTHIDANIKIGHIGQKVYGL